MSARLSGAFLPGHQRRSITPLQYYLLFRYALIGCAVGARFAGKLSAKFGRTRVMPIAGGPGDTAKEPRSTGDMAPVELDSAQLTLDFDPATHRGTRLEFDAARGGDATVLVLNLGQLPDDWEPAAPGSRSRASLPAAGSRRAWVPPNFAARL